MKSANARNAGNRSSVWWTALCLLVGLALAMLAPTTAVALDEVAMKQVKEAVKTVLVHVGNAKSETSIPLVELLLHADEMICASWLISFDRELKKMAMELTINPEPHRLETYRKLKDLQTAVLKACDPILSHTAPPGGGTAVAAGTGGGAGPAADEPSGGFVPRPGWTLDDEICYRKCRAQREAVDRAEADVRRASARAERLAQEAEAKEADARRFERWAADAENAQAELRNRSYTGSVSDAQVAELRKLNDKARELPRHREDAARTRRAADEATARARRAADDLRQAEATLTAALAALDACLKACKAQAAAATQRSVPAANGPSAADLRTTIRVLERSQGSGAHHVPAAAPETPRVERAPIAPHYVKPPTHVVPAVGSMKPATPSAGAVLVPTPAPGTTILGEGPEPPREQPTTLTPGGEVKLDVRPLDVQPLKVEPLRVAPMPGGVRAGSDSIPAPGLPDRSKLTTGGQAPGGCDARVSGSAKKSPINRSGGAQDACADGGSLLLR